MHGFSSIILLLTRTTFAGGLSPVKVVLTQSAARFAEKMCVYAYVDRFLVKCTFTDPKKCVTPPESRRNAFL